MDNFNDLVSGIPEPEHLVERSCWTVPRPRRAEGAVAALDVAALP